MWKEKILSARLFVLRQLYDFDNFCGWKFHQSRVSYEFPLTILLSSTIFGNHGQLWKMMKQLQRSNQLLARSIRTTKVLSPICWSSWNFSLAKIIKVKLKAEEPHFLPHFKINFEISFSSY